MTIYSDSDCRTAYGFEDVIIPSQMCAWVEEGALPSSSRPLPTLFTVLS